MARSLGVRILVKCGFTEILVTNSVCSLTDDMKVGDLFLALDQLNLNGQNPQFGPNEDSWGKRFYDCSNIYYKPFTNKFKEIYKNAQGRPLFENNLLFTSHAKPYASLAEK